MNKVAMSVAVCAAFLTGCVATTPKVNPDVYTSMDEFLKDLATRASERLGNADDFKIVVTQADYPIGTLMRMGSTIPIDYKACIPSSAPPVSSTPSLFPGYELSRGLAIDFGLDNEAIKTLVDFGITVKDTDTVNVSVRAPKIQTLADSDLKNLLSRADCKGVVPPASAWLVRGYILGQRTFVLKNDKADNVKGKVNKVASFNVSVGSGTASLDLTDATEVGFLQIVSQVAISPLSATPASVVKPQVSTVSGRVFVQRDQLDTSTKGEQVVGALKAASLGVVSTIERVDHSSMPTVAEVRYFNEADKPLAETALAQLQKQFPNAKLTRISLPAPTGQLEVWLPRVSTLFSPLSS